MADSAGPSFALETVGVTKLFGAVRAVDDLSISIPRGQITAVVGPNGSGKSTLVNLLSGVLPLDGGSVVIDGVGFRSIKAHEASALGLTRTFQEVRLFDQVSVLDNILIVLTERRLFPALFERTTLTHRERARDILVDVGMWEKRDSLAIDLSYGQRKLVEIGRAMALEADTYLLDEPFAGLFPQILENVKLLLKSLREWRRTILFISHNMDIVRELSEHLIVMDAGRLLAEGDAHEILAQPEVIEAYLGV